MKTLSISLFCILLFAGCNRSTPCEKEIYLLPKGFQGVIIVFFDQPDGQSIQYEDSARVYRIPSSGIIKTKFPKNGGCMGDNRIHFFNTDSLGNRVPLDYFMNVDRKSIPADTTFVLLSFLSEKNTKPEFIIHLVGRANQFRELSNTIKKVDMGKLLESL
jgi:hypothetical protein